MRAHPTSRTRTQPRRHGAAVPHVVLRRRTQQRRAQLLAIRWRGQERAGIGAPRGPMRPPAMVEESPLPLVVVAARDLPDPVRRVPSHLRDLVRRVTLRQEPEELPVTALHPLTRAPIAPLEFVHTQFRRKLDASCHVSILHQHVILWY